MAEECNAISLLHMPHEVMAGIAWCIDVKGIGRAGPCCRMLQQELTDPELWFHVFMRTCWPPSEPLLALAEECTGGMMSIDWQARMNSRMSAPAAIVVDIGRGYSKYTIVHGVRGRSEAEGEPPQIVQLCSSPTHPPDCSRDEQLTFIHYKIDLALHQAGLDPTHSLRSVALLGAQLHEGGHALVRGEETLYRLLRKSTDQADCWEVERGGHSRLRTRSRSGSGSITIAASELVAVRCAAELPLLVGEPFLQTQHRGNENILSTSWAQHMTSQLQGRSGPVRMAPQAQMSLWAHGIDHGIVVNFGQGQTIAMPVVNGEVIANACCASDIGGGSLTSAMLRLLAQKFPFVDNGLMTWARDVKENYCYAAPPDGGRKSLRARLAAGDLFGIEECSIESPVERGEFLTLGEERCLVPELFFDPAMCGHPTLPECIAACAAGVQAENRFTDEDIQKLLQQVVLVGGAADIPALRPRTEYEVRTLLRDGAYPKLSEIMTSPDEVFVLNPPMGHHGPLTTPRFVPVMGGCVRAASTLHFQSSSSDPSQTRRHSIQVDISPGQLNSRLPEWMQRRRFMLAGASIFRTGGGGGEDDDIWRYIQGLDIDSEEDDDSEDHQDSSDESGEEDEDEDERPHVPESSLPKGGNRKGKGKGTQKGGKAKGRGNGKGWRPRAPQQSE